MSPQINAAPSLTPTILDATAPDPQACPGYKASNVVNGTQGFAAELTIAGQNCQAYGNDIADLTLEVTYQAKSRLNVRIYPKHLAPQNTTQYLVPADIVLQPGPDGETTGSTSDLAFEWINEPSFQFQVSRRSSGEVLFSTYGHVIVFEDQFIEVVTNMVDVSFLVPAALIRSPRLTHLARTTTSTGLQKTSTTSVSALITRRHSTLRTAVTQ